MAKENQNKDHFKKSPDSSSGYYYYDEGYGYGYGSGENTSGPQKGIKDYLVILRERIWYVLIGFLVVFSLAIVYTLTQTPIYRATATVNILRQEANPVNMMGDIGDEIRIFSTEDFNTQVQILSSGRIIERVAERITGDEMRRFMAPYEKGGAGDPLTPIEVLGRNRSISPIRMSLMVAVSYTHPDREIAARVANYFAEEFIDSNLRTRIEESMRTVEDLQSRAEQQRQQVEEIELRMQAYRERHNLVSLDRDRDIATERLRRLNMMSAELGQNFAEAETSYLTIRRFQEEGKPLTDLGLISNQPLVSELQSRLAAQRIAVANLSERYRDRHPQMIQARQALDQAETELNGAINSAVTKIVAGFEAARRNYDQVKRSLTSQEEEMLRLSRLAVEFDNLQREANVQQQMYTFLVGRMRDTAISATIETPSARIVDRASLPLRPISPNVTVNLAMGLLGGLGLGFGVAFFVAFIDDRVKTAFDIENVVGLTLLGIVPEIKKLTPQEKSRVVVNELDRQVVESFRTLHSSLKLNNESKFAQCMLITSSVPGEGKTFTSTNLAATFSTHGEKTLIIDCDLRMPNVHKSLDLDNKSGVIDFCVQETPFEEIVKKEVSPHLDVLSTGGRAKNPTQILSSKNFEKLVAEARRKYDRIIFDTPPLAAVSDALIILPLVDGVLFTIKFNKVKRKAAKLNARRLMESNVPVFGAVLNNLNLSVSQYYYAQYYDKSYYDYYSPKSKKAAEEPLRG